MSTDTRFKLLQQRQTELELALIENKVDLGRLTRNLLKAGMLAKDISDKMASLDTDPDPNHLEQEVKVRYLLQHVFQKVKEDNCVYDRLTVVLGRLGVKVKELYGSVRKEVNKSEECSANNGISKDIQLVEQDVRDLVKFLVSGSYLWDAIGIALNLPKHKREDCGEGKENVNRLSNILTAWILGGYGGARPATLSSLREALFSETVGLGNLALTLMTFKGYLNSLPENVETSINTEFTYQSYDMEVTVGKSTLLEVQVNGSRRESYQWSKDGKPLLDGVDYSGVCSSMLYINKASQYAEGEYSCCVNQGTQSVYSVKMKLKVVYPPERRKLVEFYSLTQSKLPRESWSPVGNSQFINLVIIQQKRTNTCDYRTIRGDMDDILESKEVAVYGEVFKEYKEGALVLVEGRPGSGKTTLVHKLMRDWATEKKIFQGAKMVFLVSLRLLHVYDRDRNLLELLKIFYGDIFGACVEQELNESRGKGALFILDGLDEYPIESKKKLVINELLFDKSFLPYAMVVVASRPLATSELKTMCSTRLEVIGFSKDQIYSYVRSYPFSDHNNMATKIQKFLDQHPNVLHMCYLPVHVTMICSLFSQLDDKIPHRETQIYEQFVIATLLKHKARRGEELQLKSLKDLSGKYKESFSSICKLAFDMIVSSQQVVSKSDTRVSLCSDSVLGLLTVERTSKYYGNEDFFTFCHLTLQEFLAAFHIHEAQLQDNELTRNMALQNVWKFYCGLAESATNIGLVKAIFEQYSFTFLYKVQCAFESQKAKFCDFVIDNGVLKVYGGSQPIITLANFVALGNVIYNSTKLVKKIALSSTKWDIEGVKLFISKTTIGKLASIKCLKIYFGHDKDVKTLNCLLSYLPSLEELDLLQIQLNQSRIKCLANGVTLSNLKVLKITLPLVPCSHPEEVLGLLRFGSHSLNQVYYSVHEGHIDHVLWKKMLSHAFGFREVQNNFISWLHLYSCEAYSFLTHERLSHCTDVVLVNCCIGDEGAKILANTLNTSVLENLVLDFNGISDSGAMALAGCLARCSVIHEVSIQCNSIGDSGAIELADALVHCKSLRKLDLQGNSLGDKGALAVAQSMKHLPDLVIYLYNANITEEGIKRVLLHRIDTRIRRMVFTSSWDCISEADKNTLRRVLHNSNLPALKLTSTNFSNIQNLVKHENVRNVRGLECSEVTDDIIPTICNILKSIAVHYVAFSVDISSAGAQSLSDSLGMCKSLHSVELLGDVAHSSLLETVKCFNKLRSLRLNKFDSNGAGSFFSDHTFWAHLHSLDLSNCLIGSDGAQVLGETLVLSKVLCSLDLSRNGIGDIGAQYIANGLKGHTNLRELRLGTNFISSDGMSALIPVIRRNRLQHLHLSACKIGSGVINVLVNALCGDTLQTLNLSDSGLSDTDIKILSDGLKKCKQLQELDISRNRIGSTDSLGFVYLSKGLEQCSKLQMLNLSANSISTKEIPVILDIMKSCKCLKSLSLNWNLSVDDAADLVGGWKHDTMLTLGLVDCISGCHEAALMKDQRCHGCNRLLQLYYKNDFVHILLDCASSLPTLVSPKLR